MMPNDCTFPSVQENLLVNAIVERVHQTIGNITCSFKIHQMDLDN